MYWLGLSNLTSKFWDDAQCGLVPALQTSPRLFRWNSLNGSYESSSLWKVHKVKTWKSPTEGTEISAVLICFHQTYQLLVNYMVLSDTVQIMAVLTATSFSRVVSVRYKGLQWIWSQLVVQTNLCFSPTKCKKAKEMQKQDTEKEDKIDVWKRYTSLLELPYYGSITMCVIDRMHNLF